MEKAIKHENALVVKKAFEVSLYVTIFALAVPALFYLLGFLLDKTVNPFSRSFSALDASGVLLLGLGSGILAIAISDLGRFGRGLPASPVPPTTLVTVGLYQLSRHPIYFGASLSFLGGSLILHSFWSTILGWPLFTLFFVAYALRVEEPILEKRFDNEYRLYRRNIPLLWDFPLREALFQAACRSLGRLSLVVNRPFVVEYRSHLLFLGYGLWVGTGIFFGLIVLNLAFAADNISPSATACLMFVLTVVSLAGSRIVSMLVLLNLEKTSLKSAWHRVGFVSWGVLLATIFSSGLFFLLTRKSLYYWFDAAFMGLMISHFFGRIGCLFYGCCYGKGTRSAIHFRYTHPRLKAVREGLVKTDTLYPTQLYSSLCGLFIFTIVFVLWSTTSIRVGFPTALILVLYGILRFYEEWFRFQKKMIAGIISPAQIVCMVIVLFGLLQLGWILPASQTSFHTQIFQVSMSEVIDQLHFWLAVGMGLLTAFVFSCHRYEIGAWGKLGITQRKQQGD